MDKEAILVAGAGKIGSLIAVLLAQTTDYHVHLVDVVSQSNNLSEDEPLPDLTQHTLDVNDRNALESYTKKNNITAIVSCLPYYCNQAIAQFAYHHHVHYFDLTEDTATFEFIQKLTKDAKSAFVPLCGVAPGFINILANDLIQRFHPAKAALLRVGALPAFTHNALKYALTWSIDGLINEYANPCYSIVDFKQVSLNPLSDLETIIIDGVPYEAFNTSGGVGHLTHAYQGKIETMNYKSLRYPGHCEKIRFLMDDLQLNQDRENLKHILEKALPKTDQDVVIIYAAVSGTRDATFKEETYLKKIYPQKICGKIWSAIQVATASSACAVIDLVLQSADIKKGLILQESINLHDFLQNRFSHYYLE